MSVGTQPCLTPFLHAYAHNEGAIDLYRRMGFTHRARMQMNVLAPAGRV